MAGYEEVAISGISGRYPNCANIDELQKALFEGRDCVSTGHNRWPYEAMNLPPRLGLVNDIEYFDGGFFGMNPKEATITDPRLRKTLETVFEAIVDAGINPTELRGSKTAVFYGLSQNSVNIEVRGGILVRSAAIMANTISYYFDLRGPSYSLDTACSTSLYLVTNALEAIKNGSCDQAIICAAQAHFDPSESLEFVKIGVMHQEGKCKTWDADRKGYVKSDAMVAVVLQKRSDCRRIYATIAAAGTNVDGFKSEGITHPSFEMHETMFESTYKKFNIDPLDVNYVELHGTGTVVGDVEETRAVDEFFTKNRTKPLLIGSVKSIVGHSETASGLVSLSKALISIRKGIIPANLHYKTPDPNIRGIWEGRLKVVDKHTELPKGLIAINAFGFGGANGTMAVRPFTEKKIVPNEDPYRLVQVSGRTEEAVKVLLDKIKEHKDNLEFLTLIDNVFATPINNHNYRGYSILSKTTKSEVSQFSSKKRPIWFSYAGVGSQWAGMGKDLMQLEIFRSTMKKCAGAVRPYGLDLEEIVMNGTKETFEVIVNCFTAIVAMSVSLTDVLFALGIKPDGIIGHSLGEVVCAYADGLITAEQATLIGYARGYAIASSNLAKGLMASVGLSVEECEKRLPENVYIACDNSADNVTIAGGVDDVKNFLKTLTSEGVFSKAVETAGVTFHCKLLEPAGPKMLEFVKNILPNSKLRSKRWLPSAVPEELWDSELGLYNSAEYHQFNFLNRVQFRQCLKHVPKDAILVEVAPRGLFQAIFKRSLDKSVTIISLGSPSAENNLEFMLNNVGKLYNAGGLPDLKNFHKQAEFPVSINTPTISDLVRWDHSVKLFLPSYNTSAAFGDKVTIDMNESENAYLEGHVMDGKVILPATGYMNLVWRSFAKMLGRPQFQLPVVLENVRPMRATFLPRNDTTTLIINIFRKTGYFEICNENDVAPVCTGRIYEPEDVSAEFLDYSSLDEPDQTKLKLNTDDFYKEFHLRGYDYYGIFQSIIQHDIDGRKGILKWYENWVAFMDTLVHRNIFVERRGFCLPIKIDKVVIDPESHLKSPNYDNEIILDYNKHLKASRCGGVEVRHVHVTHLKRRYVDPDPTLLKYSFVPETTLGQKQDEGEALSYSLMLATQIVAENTIKGAKIGEIDADSSIEIIKKVTHRATLVKTTFKKVTDNFEDDFDLIITHDSGKDLIQKCLRHARFVFAKISNYDESLMDILQITPVYKHMIKSGTFVLLRKVQELPGDYSVVLAKNNSYGWIEEIKAAIKRHQNPNSRIYLVNDDYNSGVVGFYNSVKDEKLCPNLRVVLLRDSVENFTLNSKFYKEQLKKDLAVNVFENNSWGSYRLTPLEPLGKQLMENATFLNVTSGLNLGLQWVQQSSHNDNSVQVYFAGLNKWDVQTVNGKAGLNIGDARLGLEYSGFDSNGNKVMGFTLNGGALSTVVTPHPKLTWSIPTNWALEEGATVPLAYTMSYYSLFVKNKLSLSDALLIHNGTSDVSMAAISLALDVGCAIYVTVNDLKDKEYLCKAFPKLKESGAVFDNHKKLLNTLTARKVNMVFNCNSNELLRFSMNVAVKYSTFVEFNFDENTDSLEDFFERKMHLCAVKVNDLFDESEEVLDNVANNVENYLRLGIIKPIIYTVFDKNNIEGGLKYVEESQEPHKVLVKVREQGGFFSSSDSRVMATPRTYFNPEKSYVIVGGLGGFGLELTKWMLERGATKIILNGRRPVYSGYQAYCMEEWKNSGFTVVVDTSDTTSVSGAENLMSVAAKFGPVGGIFNVALVLKDELITEQTIENYKAVVGPKVTSAEHLDALSRTHCKDLDYFVAFSSVVSCLGNASQSNYGFANSALERLCESRRNAGLHGLAVQWGPVGDVGFVARLKTNVRILESIPQGIVSCLDVFDEFLQRSEPVVFSNVFMDENDVVSEKKSLIDSVSGLFGIKNIDLVDGSKTLLDLGMDSILAFEIKHLLAKEYGLDLHVNEVRTLTIDRLKAMNEN